MKRIILIILSILLVIILVLVGMVWHNVRDRHPGYTLNLQLPEGGIEAAAGQLRIGVAKIPITPKIEDTWVDADSNAKYEPGKGDTYVDNNGNGKFDAYYIAGFGDNRPAAGVHDDIWARAVVWDDGSFRIALVVLDAIGFFHDDVIQVREMVAQKNWNIDHDGDPTVLDGMEHQHQRMKREAANKEHTDQALPKALRVAHTYDGKHRAGRVEDRRENGQDPVHHSLSADSVTSSH